MTLHYITQHYILHHISHYITLHTLHYITLHRDNEEVALHVLLSFSFLEEGDVTSAATYCKRALDFDPQSSVAHRCSAYIALRKYVQRRDITFCAFDIKLLKKNKMSDIHNKNLFELC